MHSSYQSLKVNPCTPCIGAEISGIDLGQPLNALQTLELRRALTEHLVIFFREQNLSHEAHLDLGRAFGPLAVHSAVAGIEGFPEIVAIHADAESTYVAGENWHSDLTCDAAPPLGSILYLHTVPPVGGDTLFCSMYAAYDAMSARMQAYLEGLTAVHDANHVYHALFHDYDKRYPCSTHPLVRTHPQSGRKALFVNASYVTHIEGVAKEESAAILTYLYQHCNNPNFQVRFRWRPGSVAFWDNRCTQHMAVWDYHPQVRSGFRVTIQGEVPV